MINVIIIFTTAAAIYLIFRGLRIVLLKSEPVKQKRLAVTLAVAEFIIWTLFVFWAVDRLFVNKTYYTYLSISMVLVLMIFIIWFYIKDLVAGVLFKIQNNPKEGAYFQISGDGGTVKKITTTHLVLENDKGETVKVPFSKLQGHVLIQGYRKHHAGDFRLKVWVANDVPKDDVAEKIRSIVLLFPFSSFKKPIDVRSVEEKNEGVVYEVTFSAIGSKYLGELEARLKGAFAKR